MISNYKIGKLFSIVMLAVLLASCASGPSQSTSNPLEIAQSLGYERVSTVEQVPALTTFTLESVNSRTAVMGGSFGVRYLIVFSRNCPEAGFGNIFETTATGGQMDTNDSIIIDEETYCPINEIFVLE